LLPVTDLPTMRLSFIFSAAFALLLGACGSAPTPAPTVTPTLVASSTPPPAVAPGAYENVITRTTTAGFPALGAASAPVEMIVYSSYDSNASRLAHEEIIAPLLPRVTAEEITIVRVPLSGTGSAANGATAEKAALCAGEQAAYWPYHDRLFARLRAEGDDAYTGNALLDIADAAGLDRDAWNACVLSDRPQAVLDAAAAAALEDDAYSGTPTILVNGNYMLNDLVSINTVIDQMMIRVDSETGVVGNLSTPVYENPEDVPERVEVAPVTTQALASPIDITLPDGWEVALNDTLLIQDIDALRTVPFTLYKGPVTGGTGSIAMLWGFPSLLAANPLIAETEQTVPENLLTDGLRMLRLAIVEPGCNVGTDVERTYSLGDGIEGPGTAWSAVNCPELPDTRGWFVGTRQQNLNFLFFVYIDPIDPAGPTAEEQVAQEQLQAILDTVRFRDLAELAAEVDAMQATDE